MWHLSDFIAKFALMRNLGRYIEYLLWHYDCVVVPKLGAFIARYESASFDFERGVINPPRRLICFNRELRHDDGMLASLVAKFENISYEAAHNRVMQWSESMWERLRSSQSEFIQGIGALRFSRKVIQFEPCSSSITASGLFGLNRITYKQAEEVTEVGNKQAVILPAIKQVMRYAASIIVLITLALLLTTPTKVDDTAVRASLQPTQVNTTTHSAVEPTEAAMAAPSLSSDDIEVGEPQLSGYEEEAATTYYLIVATFKSKKQVDAFMAENSDHRLYVKADNGLYQIYIASASNAQALNAYSAANGIAERYPGAWVWH